jgi:hypothetical protein
MLHSDVTLGRHSYHTALYWLANCESVSLNTQKQTVFLLSCCRRTSSGLVDGYQRFTGNCCLQLLRTDNYTDDTGSKILEESIILMFTAAISSTLKKETGSPGKRRQESSKLRGVSSQKAAVLTLTAMRTSSLTL